jgi:hypothetical protein
LLSMVRRERCLSAEDGKAGDGSGCDGSRERRRRQDRKEGRGAKKRRKEGRTAVSDCA